GWSVLFFGLRQPASALAAIVFLLVLILATMAAFHRNRPVAAWLMLPYLAWVAFALVLNAAIVWMN
ncbi:MAG TPA: TspO/MBR family protein, partial [Azospirillaceae bacterium]|nr:TspO/MBR family protein [Azospirillaceae bacterium]